MKAGTAKNISITFGYEDGTEKTMTIAGGDASAVRAIVFGVDNLAEFVSDPAELGRLQAEMRAGRDGDGNQQDNAVMVFSASGGGPSCSIKAH